MTNLIQVELSTCLGIKKAIILEGHLFKKMETKYSTVHLHIPRDRSGNLGPALIPAYGYCNEQMIIKLYQIGLTTLEFVIL